MQFYGHGREVICGGIEFDEACVLLQQAETQADDIANKHSDEQNAQRAVQKHLTDELVARSHRLQQTNGGCALNDDNQQHTYHRDACH